MAKNRNKKKNSGKASMDTTDPTLSDSPQAMDTSETITAAAPFPVGSTSLLVRKVKKGVQMKRAKNARKMKAIAKAISKNDKYSEKVLKHENKKMRVHSAKSLYD